MMSCLRDGVRTRSLAMKVVGRWPSSLRGSGCRSGEKCRRDEMVMFSSIERPWMMPSMLAVFRAQHDAGADRRHADRSA